ncbi:MAG: hypothetical protein AAB530_02335 [Patescibacteria group bacterium]
MIKINFVLKEFFYVLTGFLIIFSFLEFAWPGVVLAYINLNLILIFWLIIGMLILLFNKN